jgi:hypothetical protein
MPTDPLAIAVLCIFLLGLVILFLGGIDDDYGNHA